MEEPWNGHKKMIKWDNKKSPSLTLYSVKASEACVPPCVWIVWVEKQRETASRGRDEQGVYSGLKFLKFPFATQKRDQVSVWIDLWKETTESENYFVQSIWGGEEF